MRIRKTSQSVATTGKIVNSASQSTTEAYSCDYVNNNVGIVESGSNTNGNWIKYADGTMVCYNRELVTLNKIDQATGSLYTQAPVTLKNFPKTFISVPTINIIAEPTATTTIFLGISSATTTTAPPQISFLRTIAISEQRSFYVNYIAIGKWK